jgi:hypothetical protein
MNKFLSKRENQKLSLENIEIASDDQINELKLQLSELTLYTVENLLVEELSREYPEQVESDFEQALSDGLIWDEEKDGENE